MSPRFPDETTSGNTASGDATVDGVNPDDAVCSDPLDPGDLYKEGCPCRDVLDLIGARWSVLVIGRLQERPYRFGDLRRAVPGVNQKMLTRTLRRLEEDGMVHREVLTEMRPPQVEYSLTELGQTITEPLEAIRVWTEQHLPDVRLARTRFAARIAGT
ncbi:MAG: helix-turn-helix domain-containing protein [Actinomycetota bacterium]